MSRLWHKWTAIVLDARQHWNTTSQEQRQAEDYSDSAKLVEFWRMITDTGKVVGRHFGIRIIWGMHVSLHHMGCEIWSRNWKDSGDRHLQLFITSIEIACGVNP